MEIVSVLDNIRSMHNVGSIFRTADAVGCGKIFLCGITPAPVNKFGRPNTALLKVALGAEKFVEWERADSAVDVLARLKKEGFMIFAVEQGAGAQSVFDIPRLIGRAPRAEKYALVVGNEISGLASDVLERADSLIEIPMFGKKESLNVAVAFGIVAYFLRQHHLRGIPVR